MNKTFEHLLGLTLKDALAIQKSTGIFDVRVTFTSAPAPLQKRRSEPEEASAGSTLLRAVAGQFAVSEEDDAAAPYDPLLEPVPDESMLSQARVVGVRDDGRQLIVSRFRVSLAEDAPKESGNTPG